MLNKIQNYINLISPTSSSLENDIKIVADIAKHSGLSINHKNKGEGEAFFDDSLYDVTYGRLTHSRKNTYYIICYTDEIEEVPYVNPNTFSVQDTFCHKFWLHLFIDDIHHREDVYIPTYTFNNVASGRPLNYPSGTEKTLEELAEDYNRAMGVI